jgi:hypothetical protein
VNLSTRTLTRTLWLRQGLLPGQRIAGGVTGTVEQLIGLQAQENLPPYLSLAARVDGFSPADLSGPLERRELVRFRTMRGTVHVLTPADAVALRPWVQPQLENASTRNAQNKAAAHLDGAHLEELVREALGGESLPVGELAARLARTHPDVPEPVLRHIIPDRVPVLQVPPRGLWKRSGGVAYALADEWLGRPFEQVDVEELVLRYLTAYGPASAADMTKWSAITRLGPVFTALHEAGRLVTHTDLNGRTLYDVPGAPIAEEDLEPPTLLLGTYDNLFLSHADRDRIAPDDSRKRWMGVNGGVGATLFLDGLLAGLWKVEDGRVVVEPFTTPTRAQQRGIDAEITRVEALLAC